MFAGKFLTLFIVSTVVVVGAIVAADRTAIAQRAANAAPSPLPPEKPAMTERAKEKSLPAKLLFGEKKLPSLGKAVSIGYYPAVACKVESSCRSTGRRGR